MAVLFSFAYLAAIFVSGALGSYYLEGLYKPETARYVGKHFNELDPWERELWYHRNDPKWTGDISHLFKQHDQRRVPPVHSGSAKARRKPGVPTRRADHTWSREEDTNRRMLGYIPRREEGPLRVFPNGHRGTVPLAKDEFSANDLWLLMPDNAGWNTGKARAALLKGNSGRSEPGEGKDKNGTPEKEVKSEADITTATEIDITETVSSEVEETWTTSDLDEVDATVQTGEESESSSQATTVTVEETASTARPPVDPKETLSSTTAFLSSSSEIVSSTTSTVEDTTSPSTTIFPSSEVTARKTVSTTPSTAGETSSEGTSPTKTPVPSSTVTASEIVSSTPSDRSSEGTSPSTSAVTASETVSLTPSTAEGSSSGATSPSTFTVTASETFSTTTGSSSPVPDHVIVLPRIRTARIVLSSVLVAVGLVAVAVAAVCLFRERRRKLKYDQLKLLP